MQKIMHNKDFKIASYGASESTKRVFFNFHFCRMNAGDYFAIGDRMLAAGQHLSAIKVFTSAKSGSRASQETVKMAESKIKEAVNLLAKSYILMGNGCFDILLSCVLSSEPDPIALKQELEKIGINVSDFTANGVMWLNEGGRREDSVSMDYDGKTYLFERKDGKINMYLVFVNEDCFMKAIKHFSDALALDIDSGIRGDALYYRAMVMRTISSIMEKRKKYKQKQRNPLMENIGIQYVQDICEARDLGNAKAKKSWNDSQKAIDELFNSHEFRERYAWADCGGVWG